MSITPLQHSIGEQPESPWSSAEAPSATTPAVDAAVLDALMTEIGADMPELREHLLSSYLTDAPVLVASMSAAAALGDRPGVAGAAHQLRSSSALLGASRLAQLLAVVEQEAKAGDGDLPALIEQLVIDFGQASAEFTSMLVAATPPEGAGSLP